MTNDPVRTSDAVAALDTGSGAAPSSAEKLARLIEVVSLLRRHCPWTAQQTHATLAPYAAEEAQELAEAVAELDDGRATGAALASELGDLLLQVLLHAEVGSEAEDPSKSLTLDMVFDALTAKLIRRSPHVFSPDGELRITEMSIEEIDAQWDEIKALEVHNHNTTHTELD